MNKKKKCSVCDGTGKIENKWMMKVKCPFCDGVGMVDE